MPENEPKDSVTKTSLGRDSVEWYLTLVRNQAQVFGGVAALTAVTLLTLLAFGVAQSLTWAGVVFAVWSTISLLLLGAVLISMTILLFPVTGDASKTAAWRALGLVVCFIFAGLSLYTAAQSIFSQSLRDLYIAFRANGPLGSYRAGLEAIGYKHTQCKPSETKPDQQQLDGLVSFLLRVQAGQPFTVDLNVLKAMADCKTMTINGIVDLGSGPFRHAAVLVADHIHFADNAKLRVARRELILIANTISTGANAVIESYDSTMPATGPNGSAAGPVKLIMVEPPASTIKLKIDLRGEPGRLGQPGLPQANMAHPKQTTSNYESRLELFKASSEPSSVSACKGAQPNWATLGFVFRGGKLSSNEVDALKFAVCNAGLSEARTTLELNAIDTASQADNVPPRCLRTVRKGANGVPGAKGSPGLAGGHGGDGGTLTVFISNSSKIDQWIEFIKDGSEGGKGGRGGPPAESARGDPEIRASPGFEACGPAPGGDTPPNLGPGDEGPNGNPGSAPTITLVVYTRRVH